MTMTGYIRRRLEREIDSIRVRLDARAARRYSQAPLCAAPLAPASEYRRLWVEARQRSAAAIDAYEAACGASIDAEWFHQLALLTQVVIKKSDICYYHGRLLYSTMVRYAR